MGRCESRMPAGWHIAMSEQPCLHVRVRRLKASKRCQARGEELGHLPRIGFRDLGGAWQHRAPCLLTYLTCRAWGGVKVEVISAIQTQRCMQLP